MPASVSPDQPAARPAGATARLSPVVRQEHLTRLPAWLGDPEFIARLAEDRASADFDATFWIFTASLAECLAMLAATSTFDHGQASTGLRVGGVLASALPHPLHQHGRDEPALLMLLPPFAALGPTSRFAAVLLRHARPLTSALTRRIAPDELAVLVHGALMLLRVYCLAASSDTHDAIGPARSAPTAPVEVSA
jgi:hypothetical protein